MYSRILTSIFLRTNIPPSFASIHPTTCIRNVCRYVCRQEDPCHALFRPICLQHLTQLGVLFSQTLCVRGGQTRAGGVGAVGERSFLQLPFRTVYAKRHSRFMVLPFKGTLTYFWHRSTRKFWSVFFFFLLFPQILFFDDLLLNALNFVCWFCFIFFFDDIYYMYVCRCVCISIEKMHTKTHIHIHTHVHTYKHIFIVYIYTCAKSPELLLFGGVAEAYMPLSVKMSSKFPSKSFEVSFGVHLVQVCTSKQDIT